MYTLFPYTTLCRSVEKGIAPRDEALSRRRGVICPGLQRRKVRIVEEERPVHATVELGPGVEADGRGLAAQRLDRCVACVELLQVVGRTVDEQRIGGGQRRQDARVGCRPGEADMGRIEDLHRRRRALAQGSE